MSQSQLSQCVHDHSPSKGLVFGEIALGVRTEQALAAVAAVAVPVSKPGLPALSSAQWYVRDDVRKEREEDQ